MKGKYLYIGLLFLPLFSCSKDDLSVLPEGKELDVTFYKTEDQILQALNAAYDPFQHTIWTGSTFLWGSVTSDDAVAGGGDATDQKSFQMADRYTMTAIEDKDKDLLPWYETRFKIIYRSNLILKFADPNTEIGKKGIAHAYFLKAYAYFELTRMFGDLPIIDVVPGAKDKFPRKPQADVWAAIENYCLQALNAGMPKRKNGKDPDDLATEGSVRALLGKVYVYEKKYDKAIEQLSYFDNNPEYGLETQFSDVFYPGNKHGKESIFEINFTSEDGGTIWDQYCNGNAIYTLCGGPRTGEVAIANANFVWGWGMNQPTGKLAKAFDDQGDTARKNSSIISNDSILKLSPSTTFQNSLTGYWDLKHVRRTGFYTSTTQVGQNTIALRLADVYLLLAEAYNRKSPADDSKARYYLNLVRQRAHLADATESGDALFTRIKKERQLELCLEGDRYFDLVRWGDAETELTGDSENAGLNGNSWATGRPGKITNGLFPIPQDEKNKIGDTPDFLQNPGY
jgi:hypothetical protein